MNYSNNNSKFDLWDSLTDSEKKEIFDAFEKSKDENNLLDFEAIKEKHSKWLLKMV